LLKGAENQKEGQKMGCGEGKALFIQLLVEKDRKKNVIESLNQIRAASLQKSIEITSLNPELEQK